MTDFKILHIYGILKGMIIHLAVTCSKPRLVPALIQESRSGALTAKI